MSSKLGFNGKYRTKKEVCLGCFSNLNHAFRRDCERLLTEFHEQKSLSFVDFSMIWKSMSFSCVFSLQKHVPELKAFAQNCFVVAKKYLIFGQDVYMRVGGLFLLYGLYHEQPFKGLIKIRLTYDDYIILIDTLKQLKEHETYDALYIFAEMKLDDCFLYVAKHRRFVPEFLWKSNELNDFTNDIFLQSNVDDFIEQCKTISDDVDELKNVDEEYKEALKRFTDENPSKTLTCFVSNGVSELENLYQKIISAQTKLADSKEEPVDEKPTSSMLQIKKRAFKSKVGVFREAAPLPKKGKNKKLLPP